MSATNVGELIKKAVKEAGYTQGQFEKKFGLSENIISVWASGKRNPSITSLKKIAKATNKPLNFFIENSGNTQYGDNNIVGNNNTIEIMKKYIQKLEDEIAVYKKDCKKKSPK